MGNANKLHRKPFPYVRINMPVYAKARQSGIVLANEKGTRSKSCNCVCFFLMLLLEIENC